MKAFYYPYLKQLLVRMPDGTASRMHLLLFVLSLILAKQTARAQFGSDLGSPAISTLAWDHISSSGEDNYSGSVGLTTDKRLFTWGGNGVYDIHTQQTLARPIAQVAPYFVPSPVGEIIKKVRILTNDVGGNRLPTYFALAQSGKLYAWGINNGLVGTAWPSISNTMPALSDTTKAIRIPMQLTILGESKFVDYDVSVRGLYWVAVGESGKAYHIGRSNSSGTITNVYTALPNPSGVIAGFKYVKAWVAKALSASSSPMVYLKGSDGNVYYTGQMGFGYNIGVVSAYSGATVSTAESQGQVLTITPRLVTFPPGEDIIDIYTEGLSNNYGSTYALSSSGKAYITGGWRFAKDDYNTTWTTYVVAPLKSPPSTGTGLDIIAPGVAASVDTAYVLKSFHEVAMPPGASKVLHIEGGSIGTASPMVFTLIVGDNNRVFWSGTNKDNVIADTYLGNYLSLMRNNIIPNNYFHCSSTYRDAANDYYSWKFESINYRGATTIQKTIVYTAGAQQFLILSKTGRGYFVGPITPNTGSGKVYTPTSPPNIKYTSPYPVPIANEQLLSCNTSPGTGGPLGEPVSTPGVGAIDCSKTKLYPAPVQGTPSELSLLVTINVTTVGDFSPITISGSGMSLVSGFDKVTATTTGVQTFHIPIKYNGSTLTNNFQFTIGSAGSCSADLTNKPSNEITKVWSLNNCTAITPGVLSK